MPFKFQNILDFRKIEVDKAYMEQSKVAERLLGINLQIGDLNNVIDFQKKSYPQDISCISNINEYNIIENRYRSALAKLDELIKEKESAEVDFNKKKSLTLKAKIEFEKINKLKEKYLSLEIISEMKREETIINDFASNRFGNRLK